MPKARHILAVVAVTTALCADQVVSAAPLPKPAVAEMAARLVDRLAAPFRRTAPDAIRAVAPRESHAADRLASPGTTLRITFVCCNLSPFQFRLPPPVL